MIQNMRRGIVGNHSGVGRCVGREPTRGRVGTFARRYERF